MDNSCTVACSALLGNDNDDNGNDDGNGNGNGDDDDGIIQLVVEGEKPTAIECCW